MTPEVEPDQRAQHLDQIAFAWHDATCAEGADCRSRVLHGDPRSTPVMPALLAVYDDAVADLIAAAREQGRREGGEQALRDAARMPYNGAQDYDGLRGRVHLQSLYNDGASPWLDGLADAIARGER